MASYTQLVNNAGDGMVKPFGPDEGAGIMAHTTISSYCRMIRCFTRRIRPVMTRFASHSNGAVVEDDGLKVVCDMAMIAVDFSYYMRFMFSCSYNTVVANGAISGNAGMIITTILK
jgi:hypothetical protein